MRAEPDATDVGNKPTRLAVGQAYPLPLATADGAAAHFLIKTGSVLQICLPGMTPPEESALRKGTVRAGLLVADGALLWLFQFLRSARSPALTFDCPFDVRQIPQAQRDIPTNEHRARRLPIEIHAVDEQAVLRVVRRLSLPSDLTEHFLTSVLRQLHCSRSGETAYMLWNRRHPGHLVAQCKMHVCGTGGLLSGLLARRWRQ